MIKKDKALSLMHVLSKPWECSFGILPETMCRRIERMINPLSETFFISCAYDILPCSNSNDAMYRTKVFLETRSPDRIKYAHVLGQIIDMNVSGKKINIDVKNRCEQFTVIFTTDITKTVTLNDMKAEYNAEYDKQQ